MIVDLILDRRAGDEYDPRRFYVEVSEYGDIWPDLAYPITMAMDGGEEHISYEVIASKVEEVKDEQD